MRSLKSSLAAAALIAVATSTATAQGSEQPHGHQAHSRPIVTTSATRDFKAANARMMRNMAIPYTGDPDIDFRTHMIPHHQGAMDMAWVALRC